MSKRVLIIGCGYVGLPLGHQLAQQGHRVFGLRRTTIADSELQSAGIEPLHADIAQAQSLTTLPRDFDWVVNCAATSGGTADDYRKVYVHGNLNLVEWLRDAPPEKFVFTSSTSVYGQNDGSIVMENDATTPSAETARVLVEAEKILSEAFAKNQFPVVILRLSGIYGPGRGYWLQQFLRCEAQLDGDGSRFLNMIHLEDVIGAIIAALQNAPAGSVFNVTDDEPVSQRALFEWLAAKLNRPMPPNAPTNSDANRKRGVTNKRISNALLKQRLGFSLKYPTFREGFSAELERIKHPGTNS